MNSYYHHTVVAGSERRWAVDVEGAALAAGWVERDPARLVEELAGMAAYFPHWLLVGCAGQKALLCPRCRTFAAPLRGAVRCIACEEPMRADGLLWLGHLPALARPEPSFSRRDTALRAAGFTEVTSGATRYLLVPMTVIYPTEWPNEEPVVRYAPSWLAAMGLPASSAAHHLVSNGRACLFFWGQWQAMPIHTVLQQRVVNHVASLFKIVAGQSPNKAFIGRIHDEPWHAQR